MPYSLTSSYLRSLLLTSLLSFLAPVLLIGGAIALTLPLSLCPGLGDVSDALSTPILAFLATFGNGNAWEGVIVIGCACALVGGLFDTYTFYRHYSLRKL
jgi:hypothetical protein